MVSIPLLIANELQAGARISNAGVTVEIGGYIDKGMILTLKRPLYVEEAFEMVF